MQMLVSNIHINVFDKNRLTVYFSHHLLDMMNYRQKNVVFS